MKNSINQQTTTYLMTFNVNVRSEALGNSTEPVFNHLGLPIFQYKKGDTLEVSEEVFMNFIEYGGMVDHSTFPFTGDKCVARFKVEHIDSVCKRKVWTQIAKHVSSTDDSNGIEGWAESPSARFAVEEFNNNKK